MPAAAIWLLDLRLVSDGALASAALWLSAPEKARAEQFVRPLRARQFMAGRVLLRQALASLLGIAPQEVPLRERAGLAPLLLTQPDRFGFSIAHSGNWVACAGGDAGALGLDIELIDSARDVDALAAQAFTPSDQRWLASRPGRVQDFYRLWSEYEARFKLGQQPCQTFVLPHAVLSVVLCSASIIAEPQLAVLPSLTP
jgi:4'-phosphopantetheinyl transferase